MKYKLKRLGLGICLGFAFILCWNCTFKQSRTSSLLLQAELGGQSLSGTPPVLYLSTTLSNPTSDTIELLTMTCSYEDFFEVKSDQNYKIQSFNISYKNHPTILTLPPQSEVKQFIQVSSLDSSLIIHKGELTLGFRAIEPFKIESKDTISFHTLTKMYENRFQYGKTIWSNPVSLDQLYRNVYPISE